MSIRIQNYYFRPTDPINLPKDSGLLMLRHAERTHILTSSDIYAADLTPAGRQQAYDFGKRLATMCVIERIVSSPVARCIHTAEEIARGYNPAAPLPVESLLVLHFDSDLWAIDGIAHGNLNGEALNEFFEEDGLLKTAQIASAIIERLPFPRLSTHRAQPGTLPRLTIAVSHDTIVGLVTAHLLQAPNIGLGDYPAFLNGICVFQEGGKPRVLPQR
ncbi:MAG TPA: histidine phosphatase family protein [Anaerolineaceae bacterium]